jgi:hypothetical protein
MFMVTPARMGSNEQASKLVLKNEFLVRAKLLSNLPEVYRGPRLTLLLAEALAFGIRAEAEFFLAAYGDSTGRGYWYVQLSEPILLYKFAYVLAVHVAESADQLEPATIALIWAFRDAAEAGEDWLVGDTAPLLALQNRQRNFETLGKIKVRPRAAVHWLLSKPKRRHFVAASLRSFVQVDTVSIQSPRAKQRTEDFVDDYINGEQRQGRRPTIGGLEAAAKEADLRGRRERLRAAFNQRVGGRRGRPAKALAKTAEK